MVRGPGFEPGTALRPRDLKSRPFDQARAPPHLSQPRMGITTLKNFLSYAIVNREPKIIDTFNNGREYDTYRIRSRRILKV